MARKHWGTASPILDIFRPAFVSAGLPHFNPHSFRRTIAQLGEGVCQSPEDFKAWSRTPRLGDRTTASMHGSVDASKMCQKRADVGHYMNERDPFSTSFWGRDPALHFAALTPLHAQATIEPC